jgi:radical SAM protein with 4Fe4S-binding SPASM domain
MMIALIEKTLGLLVDILLAAVVRLEKRFAPMRVSKTGYENPRTRHLLGALGYSSHAYHSTAPNIHKWLKEQDDLFPMILQVQTINRCNARCTICPYPYTIHLQEREIMDDDLYTKIVKECASETVLRDFVPMSKNEPLLDTKLEKRVAEFKTVAQPHQMVEIVTNGSGLTPVRAQRLIESGVDLITVSINAVNEKTYEKMMVGLSWQQVTRNLEALARMNLSKVNIYLRFVSQRGNRRELNEFRKRWRVFNQFMFDVNNRSGTVRGFEKMVIARSALYRMIKRLFWRRAYSGLCPYVFSMAHVLQNGDMPMCANDWQNREVLGNVREKSIREIYNSPRMKEIRELMLQGRYEELEACRSCSFYHDMIKDFGKGRVANHHLVQTPAGSET